MAKSRSRTVEWSRATSTTSKRIHESPTETRVHIVEHGIAVPASGVGEPSVPPFARRLPIGDRIAL
jgi:hypothetical protein